MNYEILERIRELISRDELDIAISELSTLLQSNRRKLSDVNGFSARLKEIQRKIRNNTINESEAGIILSKLREDLLTFLTALDEAYKFSLLTVWQKIYLSLPSIAMATSIGLIIYFLTVTLLEQFLPDPEDTYNQREEFFASHDSSFKILVLPFEELSEVNGKRYDVGNILFNRLFDISNEQGLNIHVQYWKDFSPKKSHNIHELVEYIQEYFYCDMVIYGTYDVGECSAQEGEICLRYITDEQWNMGSEVKKIESKKGLSGLKEGKIQEKIENIATFIPIIIQLKNIDYDKALRFLNSELTNPNFNSTSKSSLYIALANRLANDEKTNEALVCYKKSLEIALENNLLERQADSYSGMGLIYYKKGLSNLCIDNTKLSYDIYGKLYKKHPKDINSKYGLALSSTRMVYYASETLSKKESVAFGFQAIQLWTEMLKIDPKNIGIKKSISALKMMMDYYKFYDETIADILVHAVNELDKEKSYEFYQIACDSIRMRIKANPSNNKYNVPFAQTLSNQSWTGLFLKKFSDSEKLLREGLSYDSTNPYLIVNFAHALMFQKKFQEASIEYEKWKDKPYGKDSPYPTYRDAFLEDLDEFEKQGIVPSECWDYFFETRKSLRENITNTD